MCTEDALWLNHHIQESRNSTSGAANHILLASNGPWRRKKSFYWCIFCLCLKYQFYLFNFASGLCWNIIFLTLTVSSLSLFSVFVWLQRSFCVLLLGGGVMSAHHCHCSDFCVCACAHVCVCVCACRKWVCMQETRHPPLLTVPGGTSLSQSSMHHRASAVYKVGIRTICRSGWKWCSRQAQGGVGRWRKTGRTPLRLNQRNDTKRARRSDGETKMVQREEGQDCCWCWYLGHMVLFSLWYSRQT